MKTKVYVNAQSVESSGDGRDLSFVPPMTRRRFSPLQKVVFSLLNAVAPKGDEPKIVFASQDGEVKLTHELVEAFNEDGSVSPWKFSSSVYNAAPGLYSVFTGNRSTYTAIAAGDETIENSLLEAVFEEGGAVWCYAEEAEGGIGAAMRFGSSGRALEVSGGDISAPPVSFAELARFLGGGAEEITGKRISLRWLD